MTAIIPFESAKLPAHLSKRMVGINKDVLGSGRVYPVLSIKGKVFTLVKGKERKVITRDVDGEQEPVGSLSLTVARANTKYRVFYAEAFSEDNSEGKKPDCYSNDGVAPAADSREKQSSKCQGCQRNIWGVRDGVGTECATKTRLAVVDPTQLDKEGNEPYLLNVPAASRKSFAQAVDAAEQRGIDYNALVMRISFDKEAASPKLVFKPTGWLDDVALSKVQALYEHENVLDMMGLKPLAPVHDDVAGQDVDASELEAAIAARRASEEAKAKAAAGAAPTAKAAADPDTGEVDPPAPPKAKPAAKKAKAADAEDVPVKAKPAAAPADDDTAALLADMDELLGGTDD